MTILQRSGRLLLAATAALGAVTLAALLGLLLLGLTPVIVQSGSMTPALDVGSLLVTRDRPAVDAAPGDVVTVTLPDGGSLTHRVVSASPAGDGQVSLRLQGDANAAPDAQTVVVRRVGTSVVAVPVLGGVIAWFSGSPGILVAAGLVALLVSIVARRPAEDGSAGTGRPSPGHRADPSRTGPARPSSRLVGRRRSPVRRAVRLSVLAFALGVSPAIAAWNDTATATGTRLTAASVKPQQTTTGSCTSSAITRTLTTSWQASTVPGVVYRAVLRQTGDVLTITTNGTVVSASMGWDQAPLAIPATTVMIDVTATAGTWTGASTRSVRISPGRVLATCQEWS